MENEILACTDNDAEFIEEQADHVFNTIAPPEPGAEEEETHYKVLDDAGNIIGGCTLEIDDRQTAAIYRLWVDEAHRRQGIASALIRKCERRARERGCYLALTGTYDFQARPLYEKHGYTVNDTMFDWPRGHEHYMLSKRLDRTMEEYTPANAGEFEILPGSEEDAKFLSGKLREHDEAFAPREHAYISISKKVTDESGRIIAGITGGIDGWNGTDIDGLWVDEPYRGQGIGSGLLRAFEREAKENGADIMFIEAYDWDVEFYKKNGYEKVTGVLEDYPKGHTMYCMQKDL
ncbi:MAG: GNAT family N-acetyltransferase [Oscillospiraceae bacterium]|nr:GNAT family N-acetyltransferase [Oscillospiraceae bacterium]